LPLVGTLELFHHLFERFLGLLLLLLRGAGLVLARLLRGVALALGDAFVAGLLCRAAHRLGLAWVALLHLLGACFHLLDEARRALRDLFLAARDSIKIVAFLWGQFVLGATAR
jgi:hypothetical protein